MSSKKKNNELNNNTKDNPYDNYHGHQSTGGQKLESSVTNKDSANATGKDSRKSNSKNKKNK